MCQMRDSSNPRIQKVTEVHHALVKAIESAIQQGTLCAQVKFHGIFPT